MNLSFEQFSEYVKENIVAALPENYAEAEVKTETVVKNNGKEMTGLMVRLPGSLIAPNIYLEEFYDRYINGDTIEEIVSSIAETRLSAEVSIGVDFDLFSNWEKAKFKVLPRLINYRANEEALKDLPHQLYGGDLAVIYAVTVDELPGKGTASAKITYGMLKGYGITIEELDKTARANLEKEEPFVRSMSEVIKEMMGGDSPFVIPEDEGPVMLVVSNKQATNGASMILQKKTLDAIQSKMKDRRFFIIPSSVHELLAVEAQMSPDEVGAMIGNVNGSCLSMEDILSDHPYELLNNGELNPV